VLYFKDGDEECSITKNDLADKPDGVGDEMSQKIIQWAQHKFQ